MDDELFAQIVQEGFEAIPKEFRNKLDNVSITIADFPTNYQVSKLRLRPGSTLFGLYEGVPQEKRSHYSGFLPDKITIFKYPLLRVSKNLDDFKNRVKNTVWHEVAHHFGMNEEEVRAAERRRETSQLTDPK